MSLYFCKRIGIVWGIDLVRIYIGKKKRKNRRQNPNVLNKAPAKVCQTNIENKNKTICQSLQVLDNLLDYIIAKVSICMNHRSQPLLF